MELLLQISVLGVVGSLTGFDKKRMIDWTNWSVDTMVIDHFEEDLWKDKIFDRFVT